MDLDLRAVDRQVDAPPLRGNAGAQIALHERLVISAVVAGVSLCIRLAEIMPASRRR
jgi:hypothetical protein